MKPIIEVKGLSKRYRLGQFTAKTIRDETTALWERLGLKKRGEVSPSAQVDFWALENVSFSVAPGEVVGVIGRNGAGKSTLLKLLSRVTEPTSGEVRLRGRMASLLEVGTGFHPELTGRENIYLNGAILGMTRAEITKKFDEIVAFAEVEPFLDTPVKRYSSGMYVRLAFSVAVHLDPEILVLDEVLAVGDAPFQQKCLEKMKGISAQRGRTILFVSHNMGLIQSLCDSGVVLEHGVLVYRGSATGAVAHYQRRHDAAAEVDLSVAEHRDGTGEARILRVRLEDELGQLRSSFRMGEALKIIIRAEFLKDVNNPVFGVDIFTDTGLKVTQCSSGHKNISAGRVFGTVEFTVSIEPVLLYPRGYIIEPWVVDSAYSAYDHIRSGARFEVTSGPRFRSGANVSALHGITHVNATFAINRARSQERIPALDK